MRQKVFFEDLGVKSYKPTWDYQEELLLKNTQLKSINRASDMPADQANTEHRLLMVEHPPVFTLGKSGKREHVLVSEEQLQNLGIEFYHINRGGDITYHGPGQIVGYPILDLENFGIGLRQYIYSIEEVIIRAVSIFGIAAARDPQATGVWLEVGTPVARKICAIGVKSSRFVTMHGFALNVNTDLEYFKHINPCGFSDKGVTSLEKELGSKEDFDNVKAVVREEFAKVFGSKII